VSRRARLAALVAALVALAPGRARAGDDEDAARQRARCAAKDLGRAWSAECVVDPRVEVADRLAIVARLRQALDGTATEREEAIEALRYAAFADAPSLRAPLREALVAAGVIAEGAAAYLPTRAQLTRQLAAVARSHRSLKAIKTEHCTLAAPAATGASASLTIECSTRLRCKAYNPVDGEIVLAVGARGWKVVRAGEWAHPNAGEECGIPPEMFGDP
jgi:hypothetical protein